MLEVFAYQFTQMPMQSQVGITIIVMLLGSLLAAVFWPAGQEKLPRSVFFLRTALASLLFGANQIWWVLSPAALKNGVLALLLVPVMLGCLAFGAYILRIGQARSRDAYGHAGRGWYALIPIMNLVLLFKPSLTPEDGRGSTAAALAGLVLMGMSQAMPTLIAQVIKSRTAAALQDPAVIAAAQALQLRIDGPEAALDRLIATENAPSRIGPDATLTAVTRQDLHLTYEVRFDAADVTGLDADYRRAMTAHFCDTQLPLMKLGSRFTLHYTSADGSEVETLDLGLASCLT